jgi:hypothetical protein
MGPQGGGGMTEIAKVMRPREESISRNGVALIDNASPHL